jgi:hypothetical protein
MTFEFTPDENDFLQYLYYVTTRSKRVKKKRTINKMVILFIYFMIGLYLYNGQGPVTAAVFFILCLPAYFFYNYFEKKQYKKHFIRYTQANYKDEIGVATKIDLDQEGVSISIGENKTSMPWSEITEVNETGSLILIQEKDQNAIVIPKQKTTGIEELKTELKQLAASHNIPYLEELDWKWK